MSSYTLTPDELSEAAQKIDQAQQHITASTKQMQQDVQAIADQFKGDGGKTFSTLAEHIHTHGEQLLSSLHAAQENLKAAGATYTPQKLDTSHDIATRLG